MKFSFTSLLNRLIVSRLEIQQYFIDLQSFLNGPSIEDNNIGNGEIDYRNTSMPVDASLAVKRTGKQVMVTLGPFIGSTGNWWYVDNTAVRVSLGPIAGYDNIYESNMPVFNLKALIGQSTNGITKYCFGRSVDGGVTWTPIDTYYRGIFPSPGWLVEPQVFLNGLQRHYITGIDVSLYDWEPETYGSYKGIILVASFGGGFGDGISTGDAMIGIMCNNNAVLVEGWPYIEVECNIRWDRNTP